MADCIGPTNIIPNNNQVVLVDVNKTITVIDNNCCTNVDVTQPVTSVVQVLTGPIGAKGDTGTSGSQGPAGPSGSQGPAGPSGSSQPFSYVSGNIWATTSSLEISGSLTVSGSSTFTNIGLALFSGSTNLSGSGTLNGYNLLTSNDTGSLLLSSSFNQFTSSYYTDSASFDTRILNNSSSIAVLSSSYIASSASFSASIASLTDATSSYVLNSQTSSMTVLSASFASTASYAANVPATASYALQSLSSSYALTASYAENAGTTIDTSSFATTGSNTFNGTQTINGNVTINGTASIAYLNVTYESASVIYSSGSNQFGDASNDVQTLWGTVDIKTGPVLVTGSVTATSGFTGSLLGTASSAVTSSYSNFANTASGILGGKATHVPYFITDTTFATSSIYQSGSSTVIINQDNATSANPEALYVWQPSTTSYNVISGKGNLNNYLQLNIQNTNQGTDASSDVVATANNGNETIHYIDMGINSENYSGFLGGANDAYLYSTGHNLWIGNYSDGYKVYFFNSSSEQPIITLNSDNAEVTGSLFGTASWALNAINANSATSASYALTASYASNVPATASFAVSSSYAITASYALNALTSSYAISSSHANNANSALTATSASHALNADNALTANYAATAGNGGVTNLIAGSGITLLPPGGQGAVTIISTGGGGVTIISGSLVTSSFTNTTSFTFNHNLNTRTPIITVFDSNYNQIIPQNIQLVDTSSAIITFPTLESGFAIGSTGGTTGTALSSSYALFATYADTASYFVETDPIFVAKSASLATTGSNIFKGNQTISGSLIITGSSTLIGNQTITGSILMSGSSYISGVDYIDFDTTASNVGAVSRLKWNENDGTLDLGLKGGNVTLQIGQEEVVRVVNKTGVNLTEAGYEVVRLDGAQGNRIKVALAKGDGDANSLDTLGLVTENIAINQEGFVTSYGLVRNIDTRGVLQGETWIDGDALYLSPTIFGGITNIPPVAPSHSVRLGYVAQSSPNGSIFVKVDNGYELDELHNVLINTSSLAYGDLLIRDGNNVWINSKQLTGSYAITGSLTISGSSTFTNIGTTLLTGSLNVTGSTIQTGNNTLIGNTVLSGSISISGSSTIQGTTTMTGSLSISGSTTQTGNNTLIGTTTLTGSIFMSGDIIPTASSSFDLGSLTNPWRSIYVQSGSISIQSDIPGGIPATISNADGDVTIAGAGFQLKSGSFVPFEVSSTARTAIRVPNIPANDIGGLSIIGSSDGTYQPVINPSGMLHITSNDNQAARVTVDGFGSNIGTIFVGRHARGTSSTPTPTLSGDILVRFAGLGYATSSYFPVVGAVPTSLEFQATENYSTSSYGSRAAFYTYANGAVSRSLVATIDTTGITIPSSSRLFGTSSWAINAQTASYINPLNQNVIITGSLRVSGSLTEIGDTVITGSLTLSSGSALNINNGFYVDGQKQFNYGQFSSTQTQSGSADTAYSATFNTTDFAQGVSLVSQSRITVANTGIYNIQFSSQLHTTANQAVDFSIWFAMTGSNIDNSNTDFTVEKIAGGGYQVAALNFLTRIASGSYIELKYSKTTLEGQLQAKGTQSTPTRPATPSVILTVTQIA